MKRTVFYVLMAAKILFWCMPTHAGNFYASKDGSMVLDQSSGLVWARCSVGQNWDGKSCVGVAATLNFEDAALAAQEAVNRSIGKVESLEWSVPTLRQLLGIRDCSEGLAGTTDIGDGLGSVPDSCSNGSRSPAFDSSVFPNSSPDIYWTISRFGGYEKFGWAVDFKSGSAISLTFGSRGGNYAVRLVRNDKIPASRYSTLFPNRLSTSADLREANAQRESAERKVALQKTLSVGAQSLYLQAAQLQRRGEISSATRIYELIIEHFPSNALAVKSADQLTALAASSRNEELSRQSAERIENSRRVDSGNRARQACESQRTTCFASCPTWVSGINNSNHFSCHDRCKAISCY